MRFTIITTAATCLLAAMPLQAHLHAETRLVGTTQSPPPAALSPREAGARYGEAAGAALVCYGLKITPLVAELRARYAGDDLTEFDAQATKVVQSWRQTLSCEQSNGPNDCKVSQQWSCRLALQEIGPSGSAVRGLVEPKN
jgi:hypothetical protein